MNLAYLSAGAVFVATGLLLPLGSVIPLSLSWGFLYMAPVSVASLSIGVARRSRNLARLIGVISVVALLSVALFAAWAASTAQIGSL